MGNRRKYDYENALIGHLTKGFFDQQQQIKQLEESQKNRPTEEQSSSNGVLRVLGKSPIAALSGFFITACGGMLTIFAFLTNRWDAQHEAALKRLEQSYEKELKWARDREDYIRDVTSRECRITVDNMKTELTRCLDERARQARHDSEEIGAISLPPTEKLPHTSK